MAFTQSSEPAPTVEKFEFLDSASPICISPICPTTDERLEEAARGDFAVRAVAVAMACCVHICSGLRKYSTLAEHTCTLHHMDCQRGHVSIDSYLLPYKPHA